MCRPVATRPTARPAGVEPATRAGVESATRAGVESATRASVEFATRAVVWRARRARVWPATLLVLLLGVTGCSSGPSAGEWATTVCDALAPWRQAIVDLNERAAEQMANATTVEQTRRSLTELLGGARDATETARAAVAAAGTPDVTGGAAAAQGFETALVRTRDAYATAREQLLALPDDHDAFYDGVARLLEQLTADYEAAGAAIAGVSSPELRRALDAVPACQ